VAAKRKPGNFGNIFPKFLLREDPRTHAQARTEGRASVAPYAVPTGTVCARSLRGILVNTTPPPGRWENGSSPGRQVVRCEQRSGR